MNDIPIDIYSTRAQLAAIELMEREYSFLYDTFAADMGAVEDEKAIYDYRKGARQMAPVVHPGTGGVIMSRQGYETREIGFCTIAPERIITVGDREYRVIPVSMGNPHAVTYFPQVAALDLKALGPGFECHPSFPQRTNTEFVEVLGPAKLRLRVWERGSGETLACGTGACAALAASAAAGITQRAAVVELPGGDLEIRWEPSDGHIYMTGPALTVFEGLLPD